MNNLIKSTRDGFGQGLLELGQQNSKVVCLNADLLESCRVLDFSKAFPDRFFQMGVAEQNMAGVGTGLALGGKIPFITSFSIFSPGLNWLQIRQAVISDLNLKIASSHSGLSNYGDGASHQALEDIAMMRALPKMTIVVPADFVQAVEAVKQIGNNLGPHYLRLSKTEVPTLNTDEPFVIGKAQNILPNGPVTIIATGNLVHTALEVAGQLKNQLQVGVINMHTIKPLDEQAVLQAAIDSEVLVTLEEHQVIGGLGSAVAEYLSETKPTKILKLGVKDQFGHTGSLKEILNHLELTADQISQKILKIFQAN